MRRVSQRRGNEFFLFKPVSIVFCLSVQAWTKRVLLFCFNQTSGYDEKTIPTKAQAAARKEFARLLIGRQQRETTSTEQSKQLDPGR